MGRPHPDPTFPELFEWSPSALSYKCRLCHKHGAYDSPVFVCECASRERMCLCVSVCMCMCMCVRLCVPRLEKVWLFCFLSCVCASVRQVSLDRPRFCTNDGWVDPIWGPARGHVQGKEHQRRLWWYVLEKHQGRGVTFNNAPNFEFMQPAPPAPRPPPSLPWQGPPPSSSGTSSATPLPLPPVRLSAPPVPITTSLPSVAALVSTSARKSATV